MAVSKRTVGNMIKIWRFVRGLSGDELRRMQSETVGFAIVGSVAEREALKARIAIGESQPTEYDSMPAASAAGESRILDARAIASKTDAGLKQALDALARERPASRIALAARFPVFRPIVAEQLTREAAKSNAKIAALSALPGVVPLTDWLMPATAAGDLIVLTRNQINLVLQISACHGRSPDPRARLIELAPVVGGAFGWRAIARQLVGLAPGGIGVGIKAGIAYAGTYAVGKGASAYYSGAPVDMPNVFRETLSDWIERGASILRESAGWPAKLRSIGRRPSAWNWFGQPSSTSGGG